MPANEPGWHSSAVHGGEPMPRRTDRGFTEPKDPLLALLLAFLWPGMGQIYNDQTTKGSILVALTLVVLPLCLVLVGIPFLLVLSGFSMFDAYVTARAINARKRRGRHYE